jgi:hypothetical protein
MSNTNTTNADRNSNDNLIIELTEVKQQQLVTNYVYNPEIDSVSKLSIRFPINI